MRRVQLVTCAETPVENLASRALLQKAGFRCVGGRSDTRRSAKLALYQTRTQRSVYHAVVTGTRPLRFCNITKKPGFRPH